MTKKKKGAIITSPLEQNVTLERKVSAMLKRVVNANLKYAYCFLETQRILV